MSLGLQIILDPFLCLEIFLAYSPANMIFRFPTDTETVLATWRPQTWRAKINLPPFPSGILKHLEHTLAAYSPFRIWLQVLC